METVLNTAGLLFARLHFQHLRRGPLNHRVRYFRQEKVRPLFLAECAVSTDLKRVLPQFRCSTEGRTAQDCYVEFVTEYPDAIKHSLPEAAPGRWDHAVLILLACRGELKSGFGRAVDFRDVNRDREKDSMHFPAIRSP
jgi:hypothetical protein